MPGFSYSVLHSPFICYTSTFFFSASLTHPSYVPHPHSSSVHHSLSPLYVHVPILCFTLFIHSKYKKKQNLKDCVYYISAKKQRRKKNLHLLKHFKIINIRNAINTDCTSIQKLLLVWFCVVNTWIWKSDCSSSAIQHAQTCFAYIYYNITDSKWKKEFMLDVHISWHTYLQPPARQKTNDDQKQSTNFMFWDFALVLMPERKLWQHNSDHSWHADHMLGKVTMVLPNRCDTPPPPL